VVSHGVKPYSSAVGTEAHLDRAALQTTSVPPNSNDQRGLVGIPPRAFFYFTNEIEKTK